MSRRNDHAPQGLNRGLCIDLYRNMAFKQIMDNLLLNFCFSRLCNLLYKIKMVLVTRKPDFVACDNTVMRTVSHFQSGKYVD